MTYENIDAELVNALPGNGRASYRSLAEDLAVSVTTVSNHMSDLGDTRIVGEYTLIVEYAELDYDVTAVLQIKAEGSALLEVAERLRRHERMVSVHEVTGEFDIVGVGKFCDTDDMNALIERLLADTDITESSTAVVLNSPIENDQFEVDTE